MHDLHMPEISPTEEEAMISKGELIQEIMNYHRIRNEMGQWELTVNILHMLPHPTLKKILSLLVNPDRKKLTAE